MLIRFQTAFLVWITKVGFIWVIDIKRVIRHENGEGHNTEIFSANRPLCKHVSDVIEVEKWSKYPF